MIWKTRKESNFSSRPDRTITKSIVISIHKNIFAMWRQLRNLLFLMKWAIALKFSFCPSFYKLFMTALSWRSIYNRNLLFSLFGDRVITLLKPVLCNNLCQPMHQYNLLFSHRVNDDKNDDKKRYSVSSNKNVHLLTSKQSFMQFLRFLHHTNWSDFFGNKILYRFLADQEEVV